MSLTVSISFVYACMNVHVNTLDMHIYLDMPRQHALTAVGCIAAIQHMNNILHNTVRVHSSKYLHRSRMTEMH